MKDAFASEFEETLKKMKWPGKDVTLSEKLEQEWSMGVQKLLELQEPYVNVSQIRLLLAHQPSNDFVVVRLLHVGVLFHAQGYAIDFFCFYPQK